MQAEIAEQPAVLRRVIVEAGDQIAEVSAAIAIRRPRFVLLAARGTSDHAALYAKYLIEIELGLPAGLASPSTMTLYRTRPDLRDVLFLAISQSGGSPDLIDSVTVARDCGAMTVALTNTPSSALAAAAEFSIDIRAGTEFGVAATKTYTAQLLALYLLLAPLGRRSPGPSELVEQVGALAAAAHATLGYEADVLTAAARYRFAGRLITTARGLSYPTAREAALKLMETCYLGAQAFSGADLLHGPMAMIDAELPVIVVVTPGPGGQAMTAVLERLRQRQADLVVVGGLGPDPSGVLDAEPGPPVITLPVVTAGVAQALYPILEILPLQQLALHLALQRGGDPDAPRGLSKVTETW